MTIVDDRKPMGWPGVSAYPVGVGNAPAYQRRLRRPADRRPAKSRPAAAPIAYRGTGVAISHAAHTRRPVGTAVSFALAGTAALITFWLGLLGHFSAERAAAAAPVSDQLAVVRVKSGETLEQLAARVAPEAPASRVVQQIRELNKLDSASVDSGQTLIAPIG